MTLHDLRYEPGSVAGFRWRRLFNSWHVILRVDYLLESPNYINLQQHHTPYFLGKFNWRLRGEKFTDYYFHDFARKGKAK